MPVVQISTSTNLSWPGKMLFASCSNAEVLFSCRLTIMISLYDLFVLHFVFSLVNKLFLMLKYQNLMVMMGRKQQS